MLLKKLSDPEIIAAFGGANEEKALGQLYNRLLPKVKGLTKKYKMEENEAFDIFQESLLSFYNYVKKGKFNNKYSIDGFIMTVARNKILDELRKRSRRPEMELLDNYDYEPQDMPPVETDSMVSQEKKALLDQVFSSIGERCREILLLSVFDKRSMKEICEILGFNNENSAKSQNYKCKQKLIKHLEKNPNIAKEVMTHV